MSNDGSTGRVNGDLRRIRTSEIGLRDDESEKAEVRRALEVYAITNYHDDTYVSMLPDLPTSRATSSSFRQRKGNNGITHASRHEYGREQERAELFLRPHSYEVTFAYKENESSSSLDLDAKD